MNELELLALIADGETLALEFKGESRKALSDRDLTMVCVCMANTTAGSLLIGVEKDGTITGAKPRHGTTTDPAKLSALVRNSTMPPLDVVVHEHATSKGPVLEVRIPKAQSTTSHTDGTCQRRIMDNHGPACVPFYPHEHGGSGLRLGAEDLSAMPCTQASFGDLDPLQFERARNTIAARTGDKTLLTLGDAELAKAIGALETVGDRLVPTLSGLLLLGREEALRQHIPTHEAAFQVLDPGGEVRMNDFFRKPLVELADLFEQRFKARSQEKEVQVGMVRMPIPDYSFLAFREALLNALFHRDYRRNECVYVQWRPDHLFITSPGGFPEGVNVRNLLTHEPKPRNRRLYEAGKRLGLVEQTGRGVDKVYDGQVRYGRPVPNYSRSDDTAVRLIIQGGSESQEFAAFIFQRERNTGKPLTIGEMIGLNRLFHQRQLSAASLAEDIHAGTPEASAILERLVEEGLVEPRDDKQGRVFQFTATVYRQLGKPLAHARLKGLDTKAQEKAILDHVTKHGRIRRERAMELTGLAARNASALLMSLVSRGKLTPSGEKRGRYYHLPDSQPVKP